MPLCNVKEMRDSLLQAQALPPDQILAMSDMQIVTNYKNTFYSPEDWDMEDTHD